MTPRLSRNMNGDLLLIEDGKASSVVAAAFSPLWCAIVDAVSSASFAYVDDAQAFGNGISPSQWKRPGQ